MAETVKKSRIVSDDDGDDNLEEALMEEFNMRLKNCMSQDNLQTTDDNDDDHENEEEEEENKIMIDNSNNSNKGSSSSTSNNDPIYGNMDIIKSNSNNISRDFIKIEKEHYYEVPRILLQEKIDENGYLKNNHFGQQNGHSSLSSSQQQQQQQQAELIEEHNYENINPKNNNISSNNKTDGSNVDQYVDMSQQLPPQSGRTAQINEDDSKENYEPEYEDIDDNIITNNPELKIDPCDSNNKSGIDGAVGLEGKNTNSLTSSPEIKSVKDRMLLSTDTQPCLFFTQTVTSPMLTPSEENIDFTKVFQQAAAAAAATTETEDEISPPNSSSIVTNVTATVDQIDHHHNNISSTITENIYENTDFYKETEAIYENLKEIQQQSENIYENVKEFLIKEKETTEATTVTSSTVVVVDEIKKTNESVVIATQTNNNNNSSSNTNRIVSSAQEVVEGSTMTCGQQIDSQNVGVQSMITKIDNVGTMTTINSSTTTKSTSTSCEAITTTATKVTNVMEKEQDDKVTICNNNINNSKKESDNDNNDDNGTLKSVDIMRHINKFEQNNDSTQVHTEYVETTTIESNTEKGLKKKKTKKSRKEEKENISVNGTNNTNKYNQIINNNHSTVEDSFYNVNVKNLCRSFGDLTKVGDNTQFKNNNDTRMKEKFSSIIGDKDNSDSAKSSFNKFDALQKKNVLHVRSSDSAKAQEKFNGQSQENSTNCRACEKAVFQMEQIKAEKSIWHRNCFRCKECNKQLNVDTYESNEGNLYCKPHFKALFAPKVVEDEAPPKPRKPELIIRENQPVELPPDVVRASDKPDLGLEELHSLNVKERFQVFEQQQQSETNEIERGAVNVKRSPSILSKLARFQAKGMDIGVADESLNGIPIEESSSEEENDPEDDGINGEDADLIRAKRVQKEKPFHFTAMSDVKSKWEQGEQVTSRDERREERKQEIQSIRNRLFMGKQGKMKEAYQQAVMESESCTNLKREQPIEIGDTKTLKEKFEKGELIREASKEHRGGDTEDTEVFESEISKKSRSLFLELDAHASKPPQITPIQTPKLDVKRAREAYISKVSSEDVVKSSVDQVDDIQVRTADIQERFKFFETYKEPEKERKAFRITPPREGQVKVSTPEREVYRDPDIVRCEEYIEDSVIAKETHTATKMLNKFRQMEESLTKEQQVPQGPKPLKCFTPPPEPARVDGNSEDDEEESGSEEDDDENEEDEIEAQRGKIPDEDLLEAQKAARARQLRAKFEKWEANEIKREQNNSTVNIAQEFGEDQSQIESTRTLRARFESMRETQTESNRQPRVKVNRFVEVPTIIEMCDSCNSRVYPLEKISVHGRIYHKGCFKCMECNCVLRMDSYSYNQGLLYCMHHFKRLFKTKGNYDTGFGLGQHKEKWNTNATMA